MGQPPPENVFARILKGELPSYRVFEDDCCIAFLDIHPLSKGHTLVVPKNYSLHLLAAEAEDLAELSKRVRQVARAVQLAMRAPGMTILTNCGAEAGQTVDYLHWHVIPRYTGLNMDLSQPGTSASADELAAVSALIGATLREEAIL